MFLLFLLDRIELCRPFDDQARFRQSATAINTTHHISSHHIKHVCNRDFSDSNTCEKIYRLIIRMIKPKLSQVDTSTPNHASQPDLRCHAHITWWTSKIQPTRLLHFRMRLVGDIAPGTRKHEATPARLTVKKKVVLSMRLWCTSRHRLLSTQLTLQSSKPLNNQIIIPPASSTKMATSFDTRPPTINFALSESEVEGLGQLAVKTLRDEAKGITDRVSIEDATFDNVIEPLAQAINDIDRPCQIVSLLSNNCPSADIRKACASVDEAVGQAYEEVMSNAKLFALIDAVKEQSKDQNISEESRRMLENFHSGFMDTGASLTGPARERFTAIVKELITLRIEFMSNLGTELGTVSKTEDELKGLSKRKLVGLEKDEDGKRKVSLQGPDYTAVMEQCSVASTREDLYRRNQDPYPANTGIFDKIMLLRYESSQLLGYSTYSERRLRRYLVKSPEKVDKLLEDLRQKTLPLVKAPCESLLKVQSL